MCKNKHKKVESRGKREGRNHFAEHRSLGFSVQLNSKTTFNLLINREVKLPAFPVAALWKVSHLCENFLITQCLGHRKFKFALVTSFSHLPAAGSLTGSSAYRRSSMQRENKCLHMF